jgi:hypothetical protein
MNTCSVPFSPSLAVPAAFCRVPCLMCFLPHLSAAATYFVTLSAVDEGEERRRWVPWFLLALVVIVLGIAVFFIVQATRSESESPTQPNSSLRRTLDAKVERFQSCGSGSFPLIARLRDTAKQTTIQHFEGVQSQWDQADTVWVNSSSVAMSGTSNSGYAVCFFSSKQSFKRLLSSLVELIILFHLLNTVVESPTKEGLCCAA